MPNLRKSYIWNTLFAATYAIMSFLMTLMTIRLLGAEAGGIFSIAMSSSRMLVSLGSFGMRNYQATDVTRQFDSGEYVSSRIVTSLAMAVTCGIYAWIMRFEGEKLFVYLFLCGFRFFEALSDVMDGIIHQRNRLDLAARNAFLRTILIMVGFIGALLTGCSLVTASLLAFLMTALGFLLLAWSPARKFDRISISMNYRRVGKLLLQCLPLFLVSAASSYVINAPKVAIDLNMDDLAQAQFAVIFMPVAVIDLVSGLILRPQLNTMAVYYNSKEKKSFQKIVYSIALLAIGLTVIALGGTYFLGVPVLQWIYQVDISGYKNALLLVVLSGGGCALTSLLCQTLTVIRRQSGILAGYLSVAIITAAVSNPLVKHYGMLGATMLFFLSMVLLILFLALFYIYCMAKLEYD